MVAPKFEAMVKGGKLVFEDSSAFHAYLWKYKPTDKLQVVVTKKQSPRSIRQNKWYWGAILPVISQETGHSVDELHEIFKRMFLPRRSLVYKGKEIVIPNTTPECSTLEFTDYIERIRAEAATMGIEIPDPNVFFKDDSLND